MKITLTGSLGNISRVLAEKMVANGHEVKVISSSAAKAGEIEKLGAIPVIGSLKDAAFVVQSFKDADAVYTMVPPDFAEADYYGFSDKIHQHYAQAIVQNNIRYVVNLSSAGVALAGVEPLARFYNLENRLDQIPGLNIVHLRPTMFYTNFYGSLKLVKEQGIIGHNIPGTVDILMTHPGDIAEAAFTYLDSLSFSGHQVRPVISDVRSGNEVAKILGDAIGKPLHWVEFPDEALLGALLQNGFSADTAETLIVNTGKAIRQGMFEQYKDSTLPGGRRLTDFAREYAMAYQFGG